MPMTNNTENNWWNKKWCPLFGALPSCEIRDGVSEKCLAIIEDARCILGGFEYLPKLNNPTPERIEKSTGYPASLIEGARFLVHVCSSHEMLFDAQFRQGLYRSGTGWIEGREESYLLFDVDQLNPARLIESIKTRAGLSHEFKLALIEDPSNRPDDWKGLIITPAMIFALMSISVAWEIFVDISDETMKAKSTEALSQLLTAEKLLKAALALQADLAQRENYHLQFEKDHLQTEIDEGKTKLKEFHARRTKRTKESRLKVRETTDKDEVLKAINALFENKLQYLTRHKIATLIIKYFEKHNKQIADITNLNKNITDPSLKKYPGKPINMIGITKVKSLLEELDQEQKISLQEKK